MGIEEATSALSTPSQQRGGRRLRRTERVRAEHVRFPARRRLRFRSHAIAGASREGVHIASARV